MAIVTKDSLNKMLNNPNKEFVKQVIGRALVVLYNNQTEHEKNVETTLNDNGVGFCSYDGRMGTFDAKRYMATKTLTDNQVARWLKPNKHGVARIAKYTKQLNDAAEIKRAKLMYCNK